MALVCGDFDHDGFPDVILGSGTPGWGSVSVLDVASSCDSCEVSGIMILGCAIKG